MNTTYTVNKEKRKLLIKEIKSIQSKKTLPLRIVQLLGYIFLVFVDSVIVYWTVEVTKLEDEKLLLYSVSLILLTIVNSLIWLVILFFKTQMEKRFLKYCTQYRDEYLVTNSGSIKLFHSNRFKNNHYYRITINFSDITNLEYENNQKLLRIYTNKAYIKIWADKYMQSNLDSYETDELCYVTICNYYNDFDEIINCISRLSGHTIENKTEILKF